MQSLGTAPIGRASGRKKAAPVKPEYQHSEAADMKVPSTVVIGKKVVRQAKNVDYSRATLGVLI